MPGPQFMFVKSRVFVHKAQAQNLPTLVLRIKWKGRGGYQLHQVLPGGLEVPAALGRNYTVINFSASLNFKDSDNKTRFARHYSSSFQDQYKGAGTMQYVNVQSHICFDLSNGLL